HIASAAHRLDQLRAPGIDLELFAQAPDLHVDRAIEGRRLAAACVLEQEVARQHASRVAHEGAQQIELPAGETHLSLLAVEQAARGGVEFEAMEAKTLLLDRGSWAHRHRSLHRLQPA